MGRHSTRNSPEPSARVRPRRRPIGTAVGLIVVLLVVGFGGWALVSSPKFGVDVAREKPADRPSSASPEACRESASVRVRTASSFAPVLRELAPALAKGKDCLDLQIDVVDGREALEGLDTSGTDVWIPDDIAWAMDLGPDVLAPSGEAGSRTVLATTPIYQVTDAATAELIKKAGGTWAALSGLFARGSGVRLTIPPPATSGDGLIAFASLTEAVWLIRGMDNATVASVATRRVSREHTGPGPALPKRAGEVGLVPEYALIPVLDSAAADLAVLTGSDRTALMRYTWLPLTSATADPKRSAGLDRLFAALISDSADEAIARAGFRRPQGQAPPGAAGRLPELTAPPLDPIGKHRVDHVFAAWYPEERRANLLLVVDVSGSMREPAPGTKTPLIKLVASGVSSVTSLLPDDSRLGLWEFGSRLDGPRDHRVLVPSRVLDKGQRTRLARAVRELDATRSGTGLHDTILAAYKSAVASYRPGMPNQVLVFTDAVNEDDPGGIGVRRLEIELQKVADPDRPVALAVAAFGKKSDGGLAKALEPVGGQLVRVDSAQQVGAVFVHAAVGGLR